LVPPISLDPLVEIPRYARVPDEELEERLAIAHREILPFFPELDGHPVELRLSRSRRAAGYFSRPRLPGKNPLIYILRGVARGDPMELRKVLSHELGHHLQYVEGSWPNGEKACDLIWLSRCGSRFPRPPVYLSLGRIRDDWPYYAASGERLAREAWDLRSRGLRNYISWWESEIRRAQPELTRD
jgi:hypothetical protein